MAANQQRKSPPREAGSDLDHALAADRARALALVTVSREIAGRLDHYVALLRKWQPAQNLVAASTLPTLWTRHVADSLQLLPHLEPLLPTAGGTVVDLGSGAGFPGLVLAIALAERPGVRVHLIESNQRKAAFLREAARVTGAPATVHAARIEATLPGIIDSIAGESADKSADKSAHQVAAVTARALAPLGDLLALSFPLLKTGAVGLFLKGQDVERELTDTAKSWTLETITTPSLTDPGGRIVRIDRAEPRAPTSSSGS
jgi:16S rRNA (guanine527-N7)-methyltransferase